MLCIKQAGATILFVSGHILTVPGMTVRSRNGGPIVSEHSDTMVRLGHPLVSFTWNDVFVASKCVM